MSYKLKSLIYLTAFVASALIYNSVIEDVPETSVARPAELKDAVTHNTDLDTQEDAEFLEESVLNK